MFAYLSNSHIPLFSHPQRALCATGARFVWRLRASHHRTAREPYIYVSTKLSNSHIPLFCTLSAHTVRLEHVSSGAFALVTTSLRVNCIFTCLHVYPPPFTPPPTPHSTHSMRLEHIFSGAFALVTTALRMHHVYTYLHVYMSITSVSPSSSLLQRPLCATRARLLGRLRASHHRAALESYIHTCVWVRVKG